MDELRREIVFIQRLLSCTNNKLNKSSSLWVLYKKIYDRFHSKVTIDVCTTVINSATNHFSNYYAWNSARWFYINGETELHNDLLDETKTFCLKNFKDSAAWSAFLFMLLPNIAAEHEVIQPKYSSPNKFSLINNQHQVDSEMVDSVATDVADLLDSLMIVEWSPFCFILSIVQLHHSKASQAIMLKWNKQITDFELNYKEITFVHKQPYVDQDESNFTIRQRILHFGYKKRVLLSMVI